MRRAALALGATALLGGLAGVAASGPEGPPAPATTDAAPAPVAMVPLPKLQKAVRARDAWRTAARGLRAELRHQPSVEEALSLASIVYGVSRDELSSVSRCESTLNPRAVNGRYRGLFQQGPMFEATPFGRAGLSVWSPYAAALSTAYVVSREGWSQWQCRPGGRLAW